MAVSLELLLAGSALSVSVAAGLLAHELAHALALSVAGVPCRIVVLPRREGLRGAWATVTPTALPPTLSPTHLRVAAMMPLCLTAPFALVFLGVVPDPFAGGLALKLAAVGWLACSIPSPSDFSLFWYPETAIADSRTRSTADRACGPDSRRM